jgi:tRNA-splicing ligase RtcB
MIKDPRLLRVDPTRLKVKNDHGIDTTVFANDQVPVESGAVDELVGMLALRDTVERLATGDPHFFSSAPELTKVAVPRLPQGRRHPYWYRHGHQGLCRAPGYRQ